VHATRRVTGLLDLLRLSRPAGKPELFRSCGPCAFVHSDKARRELGDEIRLLAEWMERTCGVLELWSRREPID
jgi:hypothetical protein